MNHSNPALHFPENLQDYAPWVATHGLSAPYGKCQCGCGKDAPIAIASRAKEGNQIGQPLRFVRFHHHKARKLHPIEVRFWKYVRRGSEPRACWEWTGSKSPYGYGQLRISGKLINAHRVSYILHYGPIPDDVEVCHNCPGGDNPACSNPTHLWLGTHQQNMQDMVAKGKCGKYIPPKLQGEECPWAFFTNEEVREIRRQFANREMGMTALARMHGVCHETIRKIIKRITYQDA